MMILRSAPPSPFGRKVKIAASLLGLLDKIDIQAADTLDPSERLRQQNPLGKIPVLITEEGVAVYDSAVIVEYLDWRAGGGKVIPLEPGPRIAVMTQQALADGLMEAALLQVYENRFRPEDMRVQGWVDHQAGKVARALASLEAELPGPGAPPDAGQIAIACALGYLDLRFAGAWRAGHPRLVAWLDRFAAAVPAFETTRVSA